MITSKRTVVGVFDEASRAREAVRDLRQAGFAESAIGLLARNEDENGHAHDAASSAASGAMTGAGIGAGVAALWSLGISFSVLPIIGPVLAAGPIAAALLSAAGGAAAGGLLGALVGTGMSEDDATYYEGRLNSGGTLVTVQADHRAEEAWAILQRHGAYSRSVPAFGSTYASSTHPGIR